MGQVIRNNQQFETHIQADHRGQIVKQGPDSGAVDAFGRARISEPFTLFDSVLRHSKNAELWNETISGGTFSGGTVVNAGLVAARSNVDFHPQRALELALGANANGESDIVILTIQCSSATNATGLLGWREVV